MDIQGLGMDMACMVQVWDIHIPTLLDIPVCLAGIHACTPGHGSRECMGEEEGGCIHRGGGWGPGGSCRRLAV